MTLDRNKGFTLVELLVVITIIGLLSSVVLASLNEARSRARDARRISDLNTIQTALALYYEDNGHYPFHDKNNDGIHDCDEAAGVTDECKTFFLSYKTENTSNQQWDKLENMLSPYLSKLPKDPSYSPSDETTAAPPWQHTLYGYAYLVYDNDASEYDLLARLEGADNKLSCTHRTIEFNGDRLKDELVLQGSPNDWCDFEDSDGGFGSNPKNELIADH